MLFLQTSSTYGIRHPPYSISHAFIPMEGVYRGGVSHCANQLRFTQTKCVPTSTSEESTTLLALTDPGARLHFFASNCEMLYGSLGLGLGRCCVPFPEHPFQSHTSSSSGASSIARRLRTDTPVQNIIVGRTRRK